MAARSAAIEPSYGAGQHAVDELVPDAGHRGGEGVLVEDPAVAGGQPAAEPLQARRPADDRPGAAGRRPARPAPGRPLSQDRNSPETGENCSTPERWKSSTSCRE